MPPARRPGQGGARTPMIVIVVVVGLLALLACAGLIKVLVDSANLGAAGPAAADQAGYGDVRLAGVAAARGRVVSYGADQA